MITDKSKIIVLAHDSFTQLGGAEKVVNVFHEMFPHAPVHTLVKDRKLNDYYLTWDIRTSWLQVLYNFYPRFQHLFLLTPLAASSVKLDADILLSSSSSFAKGFRVNSPGIHVCYCHTPTRFLWMDEGYVDQEVPKLLQPLVHIILRWMQKWDYKVAQKVDFFIANSKETQKRIKEYYGRDSVVIYPPIDTEFWGSGPFSPPSHKEERPRLGGGEVVGVEDKYHPPAPSYNKRGKSNYFLLAGRLQPYKQNELIIKIFNELGLPLHVVGTGRQENYLKSIAKSNVTFFGRVSDEELRDQYRGALGFIYPQIEDAGLMPLEAAACGTASIGIAKGGSLETIIPGITGELFSDYNLAEIKRIITSWDYQKYAVNQLLMHAEKFSKENFKEQILFNVETQH